jgi:molecular chaperone DnaK (HSP70)
MSAWLLTVGAALVLVCAVLAAMGFRGRISTIGVDLGTTFSVVGLRIDSEVHIVKDKAGHNIFPSIVSFLPNGKVVSAWEARDRLGAHPQDTIFNAKRFLASSLDDEKMQAYANVHPFEAVRVSEDVSAFGKVGFRLSKAATGHAPVVAPEVVGSHVLRHLLKVTADYLGYGGVNKAVIAVPAKFTPEQRAATAAAYKAAGLKVVRVMEEPTAAAVAYQLHKKSNVHHILVYDFGGGTLDVSILYVRNGSVEVYATDGDELLGGSDFDACLSDIIMRKIIHSVGRMIDLGGFEDAERQCDEELGREPRKAASEAHERCSPSRIRMHAERVKIELSSNATSQFSCEVPRDVPCTKEEASSQSGAATGQLVSGEVSRQEFLSHCRPLFNRGMAPVQRLLSDLGMSSKDIDEVVLVGGTTRIPFVKQRLREYFDGKELNDRIDPDVTVAYGAASVLD